MLACLTLPPPELSLSFSESWALSVGAGGWSGGGGVDGRWNKTFCFLLVVFFSLVYFAFLWYILLVLFSFVYYLFLFQVCDSPSPAIWLVSWAGAFLRSCPLTRAELFRDEFCNGFFKHVNIKHVNIYVLSYQHNDSYESYHSTLIFGEISRTEFARYL